ncbi:MAG: nucleoside triphosphate pyrophosphohydrolase [Actinobacteria bacterium]|nr:nucleoside triphosphate pyrophosphohydrolase [Actinomycetota bacterium]
MSLTLVYIGAAAGLAPAASLRALAGGGAVFVPAGLDGEFRDLVAELADPGGGRLLEIDPGDGEGLDDLAARAARGAVVVALAGSHGPRLARELRRRATASAPAVGGSGVTAAAATPALVTVPPGAAFDDALLGDELVALKRIVDVLRVECPWDREQTPRDIIGYTVEEVYELADAVAAGDLPAEHGELGDLLLQVVLLARMLSEQGGGDLASVAADIETKLIRRHPHIFAGGTASTPAEVKTRWERIKVEQEGREGIFHDVPASFPAILQARKLQQRAASVGFDWSAAADAFPKIAEEHAELAELFAEAAAAGSQPSAAGQAPTPHARAVRDPDRHDPRVAHEVGDLLFATVNVARLLHVDPEIALRAASRRFERRVTGAAALAAAEGGDWRELDLSLQEEYYQRAKAGETAAASSKE